MKSSVGRLLSKFDVNRLAAAYRQLRLGNHAEAARLLQEAASLYDTASKRFGYLLPYYAYSSVRMGDSSDIEQLLAEYKRDRQGFDYHLARAVLAEFGNDVESAKRHLDLALYQRPYTESRPLYTDYQYAEIGELLYELTQKPVYKERLLDWSRRAMRYRPWYSWSSAMVGKYSDDADERRSAIAMGLFLDKDSARLSGLEETEIEAAMASYRHVNPFRVDSNSEFEQREPI